MEKILRGYYFSQIEKNSLGPRNKVLNQIKAFEKAGVALELIESPFGTEGRIRGNFILRQLVCRLPFTYVYSRHEYRDEYRDAEVFYIRFLAGDRYFVRFLRKLRHNSPHAKIIMEMADYPSTWYMTTSKLLSLLYLPIIIKDVLARKSYRKYIDRIAIIKPIAKVYGIPAIRIANGVDVANIVPRKPAFPDKPVMIAVAAMCNFHGYDRMIEGIHQYYRAGGRRELELHLVGGTDNPGHDLKKYKQLCRQYHLEETVIFHGEKSGNELDEIYNRCNLAVASLGMYRIGYQTANSLKVREYLAKGLPVIAGCDIDLFQDNRFTFWLQLENDDRPVDLSAVFDFFDRIYHQHQENYQAINREIRTYAEKYCNMDYAFKNVIDYVTRASEEEIIY